MRDVNKRLIEKFSGPEKPELNLDAKKEDLSKRREAQQNYTKVTRIT